MMAFMQAYAVYVVLAINLVVALFVFSVRRAFVSKEEFATQQAAITALDARVGVVETELDQLPDKDDFHQLQLKLTETIGELNTVTRLVQAERSNLAEQIRRHEAVLSRHEQIFADAARGGKG